MLRAEHLTLPAEYDVLTRGAWVAISNAAEYDVHLTRLSGDIKRAEYDVHLTRGDEVAISSTAEYDVLVGANMTNSNSDRAISACLRYREQTGG
jgi:hypothetical protein